MRVELQMGAAEDKCLARLVTDDLLAVNGGQDLRERDCAGTTSRCGRTSRAIFLRAEDGSRCWVTWSRSTRGLSVQGIVASPDVLIVHQSFISGD